MNHEFLPISTGPDVLAAKCSCRKWMTALTYDEVVARGITNLDEGLAALKEDHASHVRHLQARAARPVHDESFY